MFELTKIELYSELCLHSSLTTIFQKKMSLLSNIRIKSGVIINDACNIQLNKFYVLLCKASYRGDSSSHYVIMYIIISRMREINIECNKTCNVYYTREGRRQQFIIGSYFVYSELFFLEVSNWQYLT